jgi:hypothetical protein
MKYFFTLIFLLMLTAGCRQRQLSQAEMENKLKETMKDYLDKKPHKGVVFTIKDVIFYPEKTFYRCEFHVDMRYGNKDTSGIMTANILKDFSKVERLQ